MTVQNPPHPQKSIAQLQLINAVSTRLQSLIEQEASQASSQTFFESIIQIIKSSFDYYSISFWSVNPETLIATLEAHTGAYQNYLQVGHSIKNEGITGFVISEKKTYVSNDTETDSKFTNLSTPVFSQSELCVPILKEGKVIATLNIESDKKNAFDQDDQIAMEALAAQIAVAITNRNLYQEIKGFNEKLTAKINEKTTELKKAHFQILEQQKFLQKENQNLRTLVEKNSNPLETVGKSASIQNILTMIEKIAPTTATVLIQGESGTGKELVARQLHYQSNRALKPFVIVNCGALQESLLESELFGHEKGSFTGAIVQKTGLAELAHGGTLFLDEIGEMAINIQAKVLRFLQEGEFYRIGGKRPIKVDVRVISATNRNLETEVKAERFREDLYYRLNTITLRMPPLRERRADIPLLVQYFLDHSRFGNTAKIKKIDPRVIDCFLNYDWPGNIRELQNIIERLKILAEKNEIRFEDLPLNIRVPEIKRESTEFSINLPLEEVEKNHILRSLAYHDGNKTKTAHSLGVTIKTLYNKLHRYGILPSPLDQTNLEDQDELNA